MSFAVVFNIFAGRVPVQNKRNEDRDRLLGDADRSRKRGDVSGGQSTQELLMRENDRDLEGLGLKISALKNFAGNIHNEMNSQHSLLDGLGTDFDRTGGLMRGAMRRATTLASELGNSRIFQIVGAMLVTFLLLWYIFGS